MNNSNELAKLHCLHSLFSPAIGNDLFLSRQIKSAVEYYFTGSPLNRSSIQSFSQTVPKLLKSPLLNATSSAFCFLDFSEQPYDPSGCASNCSTASKNSPDIDTPYFL